MLPEDLTALIRTQYVYPQLYHNVVNKRDLVLLNPLIQTPRCIDVLWVVQ